MSELENKKQIVKDLLEKGKKKGVLTHNEIIQSFYETEITAEEMETVYDAFEKEGIEVVEDLEKELEEIDEESKRVATDYVRLSELDERKNALEERLLEIYEEIGV